ncbi:hypothetical protein [Pseudomonas sp. S2.OTC.A_B10]|uniref:hypothetical protein n=1 Tax=Pseudomonas sp. S2.OTC.A_B10 TaxID=3237018 RepID=UPI003CF197A2
MWNSSVAGHGAGSVRYDGGRAVQYLRGAGGSQGTKDDLTSDKETVTKLLRQLDDAEKTAKSQTAQDLRDKLHEKRKELGEDAFKAILDQLKKELSEQWLELLKRLFPDLFPDAPSPSPAPTPSPGGGGRGGGGGGGGGGLGPSESMSNKPITAGAQHFNYKPDTSNPGKKPDNIWSGFSQGPDGNCITVSAIKAAMMQFGQKPTDVFKDVKQSGNGFEVTMRDGFKLSLSQNELQQAATHARFKGDDPAMMTDANFMYAASAKRAQMENNDGTAGRSFQAAMNSLNDGEYAREGLDRLGLKGHYRPATDADLRNSKVGTVEYGGHSMAVIGGRIELWGQRGGVPQSGTATVLF